jgi:uncharacterized membrane protein YoaK (UPF0700 family)
MSTGIILSWNSGFLNGLFLSGSRLPTKQAVAAVTGAWTNSALGLASGKYGAFAFQVSVLLCYILGSAVAGYMNPYPTMFDLTSRQEPIFLVASALTLGSMFLPDDSTLPFCLAAIVNGIQNSFTSSCTGNLCRTTHFTGISSDMGTFLGQMLHGNKANLFKLQIFALLAAAFWTGGFLS